MVDISPHDKFTKYTAVAVLALLPIVGHAGGLGVAPLVFIMGLVGLFLHFKSSGPKFKKSPTFILLVLFLTWLCVTSLWSPYKPDDVLTNYIKLFIMGLVFYFCPVVLKNLSPSSALVVTRVFLTAMLLGALLALIDIWSGFKVTFFFDPISRPEELEARLGSAEQNTGHGITLLALLSAPIIILLKAQFRNWKIVSFLFLVSILLASYFNGLWVGAISIFVVSIAMVAAWNFPIKTPKVILMFWVAMIFLAPLLALFSSYLSQSADLTTIPESWEHRLRMWGYCWDIIQNNPIVGDGFDAARTYDETWITRNGIDWPIVSLHPHNAGIHIWTEAGFIGALLASCLIMSLLKPISTFANSRETSALVSGVLIASLLISSTTYGAWQFWWWGCIFLSIGVTHLIPNTNVTQI